MYKKIAIMALGLGICLGILGCSNKAAQEKEPIKLTVFAAASLTETLSQLGNQYMAENKDVKVVYNFDSSGTLKKQIQEGAECDVFLSAGQKQMNQLDATADEKLNPTKLDFLLKGSRFNILENKVALVVPKGNPKNIKSFDDLVKMLQSEKLLLAIGNADVPVGQYTQQLFHYYKLDEKTLNKAGKLTYGSNVKEVATQVKEGAVDAGIIYQTDAASAKLEVVATATKEMCGQVIYPAAILKASKNQAEAQKYLEFLKSAKNKEAFVKVGFTPLK